MQPSHPLPFHPLVVDLTRELLPSNIEAFVVRTDDGYQSILLPVRLAVLLDPGEAAVFKPGWNCSDPWALTVAAAYDLRHLRGVAWADLEKEFILDGLKRQMKQVNPRLRLRWASDQQQSAGMFMFAARLAAR